MKTHTMDFEKFENSDKKFKYAMLGRLVEDCKYYLGYGGRCSRALWAGDELRHAQTIWNLYKILKVKPKWITCRELRGLTSFGILTKFN